MKVYRLFVILGVLAISGCNCEHERTDSPIEVVTTQADAEVGTQVEQEKTAVKVDKHEEQPSVTTENSVELSPSFAGVETMKHEEETTSVSKGVDDAVAKEPQIDSPKNDQEI